MKTNDAYEKHMITSFINILLTAFKWLCLVVCIISAGFTIGLFILGLINGGNIANIVLARMMDLLTIYSEKEIYTLIETTSKIKIMIAGIGYGFATSLTYGLIYYLADRFKILFKSIIAGDMFKIENIKMINDCLPLTLIVAFAQPVIMYCVIHSTGLFSLEDIKVSGIIFICIAYLLKLIFEKGYELEKKNIKNDKELSDLKARDGEIKLNDLKKSIEKEEKNKKTTKTKTVNTKSTTKKEATKTKSTKKA